MSLFVGLSQDYFSPFLGPAYLSLHVLGAGWGDHSVEKFPHATTRSKVDLKVAWIDCRLRP